jgi:hypothetical protein
VRLRQKFQRVVSSLSRLLVLYQYVYRTGLDYSQRILTYVVDVNARRILPVRRSASHSNTRVCSGAMALIARKHLFRLQDVGGLPFPSPPPRRPVSPGDAPLR